MLRAIPENLLNVLVEYLAHRPWIEVHQLITALSQLPQAPQEAVLKAAE